MVVCAILSIALVMLSSTVASTSQLIPASRESYVACVAAANVIEEMHNADPDELWALYNSNPDDDPDGPGTAPGSAFAVAELTPADGDPDGLVGEILLPDSNGLLLETLEIDALGLPRDLNANAKVDDGDRSGDWLLLPVVVRVHWRGQHGTREFSLPTMLVRQR
jgi:hypothetical protein